MKNKMMLSFASAAAVSVVGFGNVAAIIFQATGWNPPDWLVWALIGVGTVGAVAALILIFVPGAPVWIALAVWGAGTAFPL